jgi:hypothetical protein
MPQASATWAPSRRKGWSPRRDLQTPALGLMIAHVVGLQRGVLDAQVVRE